MTDALSAVLLEICVESPTGVAAAARGGADRIELCAALAVGGLTPSAGLADTALSAARTAGIPLFAMVRPRPGDFTYDADELALAIAEAKALIDRGVDGLVFGACAGGAVMADAAQRWIETVRQHAGRALPCTFHRAIDLVADPVAAVEIVAGLGFDRILTSGGALRAIDGAATIRAMALRGGDRIAIVAGSGVTAGTAAALAQATGIGEFHASASRAQGALDDRVAELGFATAPRRITDAVLVRGIRAALDVTELRR